jgi:acetylornithine deacetylase/succinyl-diaminopimelate desuccinylase-like protein
MTIGKTTFYPVQVAEKGLCWLRARVRGEPGHGSMPREDSAVVRLASAIARLGKTRLPLHPPRVVMDFFAEVVAHQPAAVRALAGPLLRSPSVIGRLPALFRRGDPSFARSLAALLSNTVSPTVLRAGTKTNVIPHLAECELDGRTLPGQTHHDLMRELGEVLGPDVELEVIRHAPPTTTEPVRSPLYDAIARVVPAHDPGAVVLPYLTPGFTDGQFFSRLGAKWYGFAPVKLPRGTRFADLFHGHDERIPIEGLKWGTGVLCEVVKGFCARELPETKRFKPGKNCSARFFFPCGKMASWAGSTEALG